MAEEFEWLRAPAPLTAETMGEGIANRFAVGPQAPAMVPGGQAAPLLFMKPIDAGQGTMMAGWAQLKIDGLAAGMIDGRILTSEGSPFDAALHCQPGLKLLEQALARFNEERWLRWVIIGEYAEAEGYDATMGAFKRGDGTGIFWVYDAVPFDHWVVDRCTQPIELRLNALSYAMAAARSPFVGFLRPYMIDEPYRVLGAAKAVWALGQEGIVVKRAYSTYQRRRSEDWVRVKELVTVDVIVTDIFHKSGRLAKLICKDPANPLPPIAITSGWSAEEEHQIMALEALPTEDRWIEIAYNKKAGSGRPRHARFIRRRMSKGGA